MVRSVASLVLSIVFLASPDRAEGSAGDPLSDGAPSFDSPRPEAQPYELGDYSVSDRNGALSYTIAIDVPPGRQGAAPTLALVYSSQGSLRGGVADRVVLDLERIQWDPKVERIQVQLGATSGYLVPVDDLSLTGGDTYRLEHDDSFTRFEHVGKVGGWVAFPPDGTAHYFGDTPTSRDGHRWLLTRVVDRFGNTVRYNYAPYLDPSTGAPFDLVLDSIEYTENAAAGLAAHALVELEYDQVETCPGSIVPIGARADYSAASPEVPTPYLEGSHKLTAIRTYVRDTQLLRAPWGRVREYALGYDESKEACDGVESPRRVLSQVQETAWGPTGTETRLPPITFEYAPGDAQFTGARVVPGGYWQYGTRSKTGSVLLRTLMDLNGDGIQERVRLQQIGAGCRLVAEPLVDGLPGAGVYDLPLMPWRDDAGPRDGEGCTLSGQFTWRANLDPISPCTQEMNENLFAFQDWDGDGRVDLLTAILADDQFYDANLDDEVDNGTPPTCPMSFKRVVLGMDPSALDRCFWETRMRLQRKCGRFAWRVYRNVAGAFEYLQTVWVPAPMLPDGQRANLGHGKGSMASPYHAVVDLNGDRRLDLVWATGAERGCPAHPRSWAVYFGHSDGTYDDEPSCWEVPEGVFSIPQRTTGDGAFPTHRFTKTTSNLVDISGDGLVDLVTNSVTDPTVRVYMNYGAGFLLDGWPLSTDPDPLLNVKLDRSRIDESDSTVDGYFLHGTRKFLERTIDVDSDGLPDIVWIPEGGESEQWVRWNVGDVFLYPVRLSPDWVHAQRLTRNRPLSWRVEKDMLDVTGDGRPDQVAWDGASASIRYRQDPSGAPGLLRRVDNHRGLVVDFRYASTLDRTVVSETDRPWDLPQIMWVAREVSVTPAPGAFPSITEYRYAGPVYGSESGRAEDPRRFLGFEHTYTDLPPAVGATGRARTERRYEYELGGSLQDQRGRLVETWTFGRDPAGNLALASYEKIDYAIEPLFAGAVTFVHSTGRETHTCANGESLTACMTSGGNALYSAETWTPWPDAVSPKLYVQEETEQRQAPPTAPLTPGDRKTFSAPEVRYGGDPLAPTLYVIAPQYDETHQAVSDGAGARWEQSGLTITTNDPIHALPIQTDVYFDLGTVASTQREFDPLTGNLRRVTKPAQVAGSSAFTRYEYDDHELFVHRTTNELGHVVESYTDVGTGVITLSRGPNRKGAAWDESRITIDGFGRMLERYVSVDHPVSGYAPALAEWNAYEDWLIPNSTSNGRLLVFGAPPGVTTVTLLDGLGRPTETRKLRFLPPPAGDEVVTFEYDRAGNLSSIRTPDPRVDTGATVTTTFAYDALSRPVELRRPDGHGLGREYDGFLQTTRELTADGSGATTVATYDHFGQLARVEEQNDLGGSAYTTYVYDGDGQLIEVMDADGNATTLAYDWAGHRTTITRGDRTWRYGYDLNGNLRTELPPRAPGASAAEYTTVYFVDDLDRVVERLPATMGRSASRMAELGIGRILYSYDGDAGPAENAIGRLSKVTHLVDDPTTPTVETIETDYTYLARGLVSDELHHLEASCLDDVSVTQSVHREYNASDLPTKIDFDDGTTWTIGYDARGLTSSVDWLDPSSASYKRVATFTNSLAGQVRQRLSPVASGFGQWRTTTFDELGRPSVDAIGDLVPLALHARRDYGFNDSGDLTALQVLSPSTSAAFSFSYDLRHRLRTAVGASGYAGSWIYSLAGNVSSASIGGPVHPRTVTYEYGAVDPQAVDALRNPDGTTYASFTYDPAGNMVQRTVPEGSWNLEWDNEDALREASGPTGTEAYWYDHAGSRILALSPTGSRVWFAESETDIDSNGGERRWIHVSAGGSPLARVEDQSTIELWYADHLQSATLALAADGTPTVDFVYEPWGAVLASSGATDTHRRRFNGKENDEKTGLNYYGFRYYDPLVQRWISSDPLYRFAPDVGIGSPPRYNLYAFSGNNPVRYLDPHGRDFERIGDMEDVWVAPFGGDVVSVVSVNSGHLEFATTTQLAFRETRRQSQIAAELNFVVDAIRSNPKLSAAGARALLDGPMLGVVPLPGSGAGGAAGRAAAARAAAGRTAVAAEASAAGRSATKASTIQANRAAGEAAERSMVKDLKGTHETVETQVTIRTNESGVKTRVDAVTLDKGSIACHECKASPTAPLTKNQSRAFPELERSGGVVVGKGKPAVPGGTQISPTKVQVHRPTGREDTP